ncbi:MAG: M48 family metallopeptidase [Clostridia bacterium]|nr:M48 family metallopeptidase [Clostridia bacterium]
MIVPDKIVRSKRKTLSVAIDACARIIVRAPKEFPTERIFSFLEEKEEWIQRQVERISQNKTKLAPEDLDGWTFSLLGKPVLVRLTEQNRIRLLDGTLYLPRKNAKARLLKWLKENAKRIFSERCEVWSDIMQVTYQGVFISSARTRWGVCTADDKLRFSFRLLYAEKAAVDYVVVHELCHTVYKNHKKSFWKMVERYIPDWKKRRRYLKDNAVFMQIL